MKNSIALTLFAVLVFIFLIIVIQGNLPDKNTIVASLSTLLGAVIGGITATVISEKNQESEKTRLNYEKIKLYRENMEEKRKIYTDIRMMAEVIAFGNERNFDNKSYYLAVNQARLYFDEPVMDYIAAFYKKVDGYMTAEAKAKSDAKEWFDGELGGINIDFKLRGNLDKVFRKGMGLIE